MKLRRLRDGDVLEDGDVVPVRGGDLDPDILCADAVRYHSIYGVYGISVSPFAMFPWMSSLTVGFDDLGRGVQRLASCPHRVAPNAYHDA
jgi:hypothetical protein